MRWGRVRAGRQAGAERRSTQRKRPNAGGKLSLNEAGMAPARDVTTTSARGGESLRTDFVSEDKARHADPEPGRWCSWWRSWRQTQNFYTEEARFYPRSGRPDGWKNEIFFSP